MRITGIAAFKEIAKIKAENFFAKNPGVKTYWGFLLQNAKHFACT